MNNEIAYILVWRNNNKPLLFEGRQEFFNSPKYAHKVLLQLVSGLGNTELKSQIKVCICKTPRSDEKLDMSTVKEYKSPMADCAF